MPPHHGRAGATGHSWEEHGNATHKGSERRGADFSVVGVGTGPLGDLFELLDEKTSIATVEQALASGVKVFELVASLRQRTG